VYDLPYAAALGRIGPAAIPPLVKLLRGPSLNEALKAAIALGEVGPAAREHAQEVASLRANGKRLILALIACKMDPTGEIAVPALAEALKREPGADSIRQAVEKARPGASAVPALLAAMKQDGLRGTGVSPWELVGPAGVPRLVEALQDSDARARRGAAARLGSLRPVSLRFAPALVAALKDRDGQVRIPVIQALGRIGPRRAGAIPELTELLLSWEAKDREAAALALQQGERDEQEREMWGGK
jgi:HEAT repeat protein